MVAAMSTDMIELITVVATPAAERLIALLVLFALLVLVKAELSKE